MGRAEFGSDWTGMELKARQLASTKQDPHITFLPDEAGVRRNPGVGVHGVDCWFVQTADGREIVIRSEQEARKRWSEERQKLLDMWRAEYAARKKFDAVVTRFRTGLYEGNLHAVALLQRDGRWVKIPVHVWARSDISAIFELEDSDTNWRNPNVISFSTEIEGYGTRNVKGTTLISEGELQVLLGQKPEHPSEHETEDDRQWPTPLRVTRNWALADALTVRQAACLWVGAEPSENPLILPTGVLKDQISAIEQMLIAAIQSGVLDADSSTNAFRMIGNHSKTMVPRKALRAFAESKNQRPDFLFDTLRPQEGATKGSKGRPKGTGSFAAPDAILVNEMSSLLNNGKAKSVHDAATQLADKAVGNSEFESKVKRLIRRYKESLDNK